MITDPTIAELIAPDKAVVDTIDADVEYTSDNVEDTETQSATGAKASKSGAKASKTELERKMRRTKATKDGKEEVASIQDASKSGKAFGKPVKVAKVIKQEDESSSRSSGAEEEVITMESVKKMANAILIDTGVVKPGKSEKYETNEDFDIDFNEKRPKPFGRTKAAKKAKVFDAKGGK